MEFKIQKVPTKMDKGHKDWQLNKAADLLEKLGSWREDSSRQFASIINSNCNFINRGINELVEEMCGLKAQLAGMKNERNGLLQTIDKLTDENRQLKSKLQPLTEPGKDVDGTDVEIPDVNQHDVNSESKDNEMMEDEVEESDSDQELHEHSEDASNDGDTMNESTNEMANEDVDDPEYDPADMDETTDELEKQEQETDETKGAKEKEVAAEFKKKYQCDVCGYTSSKNNIKQHKNTVHNKEESKKFMCESCPFTSKTSAGLNIHKEWRHTDYHKYECDLCPYKTTFIKELRKHSKRAHKKN